MLSTCDSCLAGRHVRCSDRRDCQCSICRRTSKPPEVRDLGLNGAQVNTDWLYLDEANKPLQGRPSKGKKVPEPPDPAIAEREIRAAYAREWRRRKREGEPVNHYHAYTEEQRSEWLRLRVEEDLTLRQIADRTDAHYATVSRWLKRLLR